MTERHCATGNHFRRLVWFRIASNGKPARDCMDCENARVSRPNAKPPTRTDGVDIDAIHWKLGAVAPHIKGPR